MKNVLVDRDCQIYDEIPDNWDEVFFQQLPNIMEGEQENVVFANIDSDSDTEIEDNLLDENVSKVSNIEAIKCISKLKVFSLIKNNEELYDSLCQIGKRNRKNHNRKQINSN